MTLQQKAVHHSLKLSIISTSSAFESNASIKIVLPTLNHISLNFKMYGANIVDISFVKIICKKKKKANYWEIA